MSKRFVADYERLQYLVRLFNENRAVAREGKEMLVSVAPRGAAGVRAVQGQSAMVPMPPDGSPRVGVEVLMPEPELWWLLKHTERCARELLALRMDKAWEGLDLPGPEDEDCPG